ncbi:MAG: hypothetical protein ACE5LS_04695 [Thermoplasmata archaeon]
MKRRRAIALLFLLLALTVQGPFVGGAQAQDEEQYFRDIGFLIEAAEVHLKEASDAILTCAGDLVQCTTDPMPIVVRLNASRDGLSAIRSTVLVLVVPERYRAANGLVAQGLNDTITGIGLYADGVRDPSEATLLAGSDLFSVGLGEIDLAKQLLAQSPPASPLVQLLMVLIVALAASVAVSVGLILWWYRRVRRAPPRGPSQDE